MRSYLQAHGHLNEDQQEGDDPIHKETSSINLHSIA